jgi:hypothetical protein
MLRFDFADLRSREYTASSRPKLAPSRTHDDFLEGQAMPVYAVYFERQHHPVLEDEQGQCYPLRDGVLEIEIPQGNPAGSEALQDFGLVHAFGWLRTRWPVPAFLRGGVILFDQDGKAMLRTPVPVTVLPAQAQTGRLAQTYRFTSRAEQIEAAFESYGQQGMARLLQEFGTMEQLPPALLDAEGSWRRQRG